MIFITGSSSFVGQKLIQKLKKEKIHFIGIDNNINNYSEKKMYKRNINDKIISKLIKKNSTIIHLAAISNVKDCQSNPIDTLKSNINGTINILDQSIKKKAKHFIFASTEWVYPNKNKVFKENYKINIDDLDNNYSVSKLVGEEILLKFKNKIKITILRFGIIYSDRKNGGSAVESLVNSVKNSNFLKIGSKKTSRRFVHIDDIIEGIFICYKKKVAGTFNLSGDKDITLEKIIKTSSKFLNKKIKINIEANSKPSVRRVSNLKSKKILGWYPNININDGIKKILK
ncbi:NAD(P)-dependent oxidoreductase [Candidatus Pelagibacter sp.]|nr:NAD(P)-dependent oxidoreductase [Candidatus Pelagibacter sp.]